MPAKTLTIEGYGDLFLTAINIKERDFDTVDPQGRPVERKVIGERAKTVHLVDGQEVPSSMLCKKIQLGDEEIIAPKFKMTSKVPKDSIEVTDDNGLIYRALDRKFYNVVTNNDYLKQLILKEGKSLEFPFVAGGGWKIWKAMLTRWNDKLLLVACRGDLIKELEKYSEETVDFQIDIVPQEENAKKLVKAMFM